MSRPVILEVGMTKCRNPAERYSLFVFADGRHIMLPGVYRLKRDAQWAARSWAKGFNSILAVHLAHAVSQIATHNRKAEEKYKEQT
jgi:hypothetical protein